MDIDGKTTGLTISKLQLDNWQRFIENELGFVLPQRQQHWLKQAIISVAQSKQLSSGQLLQHVEVDSQLRQQVFDAVLIGESRFFRHTDSLQFIADKAKQARIDALMQPSSSTSVTKPVLQNDDLTADTNALSDEIPTGQLSTTTQGTNRQGTTTQGTNRQAQLQTPYSVWSVGCSRGQEVWSLAMVLDDLMCPFEIYGSDANQQVLVDAKNAIYNLRELHNIPKTYQRYTIIEDKTFWVNKKFCGTVNYIHHNIFKGPKLFVSSVDAIICQNVLIYFRQFDQRDILTNLVTQLAEGGYILLAPGEAMHWQHPQMRRVDNRLVNAWQKISEE